jgi:hypothetical protein
MSLIIEKTKVANVKTRVTVKKPDREGIHFILYFTVSFLQHMLY